jgi:D-alanyl-D-alanine carboxypeptidase
MKAAGLILWAALAAANANATDYKPVRCDHPAPYVGPGVHAPATAKDFQSHGALDGVLDPQIAARLQAAFDRGLAASPGVKAITVTVAVPGRGVWTAQRAATGDPPAPLYWWASAGKMFTAATILQLADEGKLSLSDPVSRWVAGVPNGDVVTVEHLLNHTSGLFSANEDLVVRREDRPLSFEDRVEVAARHGAMFCPGERWRYSNTGYDLLGRIVEAVDERPYAEAVTARIVTPLGLRATRILAQGGAFADMAAIVPPGAAKPFDPTQPGPAGAVVASSPDMVAFLQALLGARILKPETTASLLRTPYPMFDPGTFYGLGLMLYDIPAQPSGLYWIGHSGGAPGVAAQIAWSPRDKAFVAVALTGEGSPPAFANALLKAFSAP